MAPRCPFGTHVDQRSWLILGTELLSAYENRQGVSEWKTNMLLTAKSDMTARIVPWEE